MAEAMGGMSDNSRGAMWMTICMVAFTCNDALMKAAFDDVPLTQALFLRGLCSLIFLTAIAYATGALKLPEARRDRRLILLRTLVDSGSVFLVMIGLKNMPLANVSAILQVLPLSVALAAALFFGEALGWRRLVAILVGFGGVLLIVRPGGDGFSVYSLCVLAAVCGVTVRDLAARRLSASVPSMTAAFAMSLGVTVFGGAASMFETWVALTPESAAKLLGASVFIVIGYISSLLSMRIGDLGATAPFRYAGLLAALILGLLVFGDWPAPLTLLGAAIIVATGIFTLYRERQITRARTLADGTMPAASNTRAS